MPPKKGSSGGLQDQCSLEDTGTTQEMEGRLNRNQDQGQEIRLSCYSLQEFTWRRCQQSGRPVSFELKHPKTQGAA